MTLRPFLLSVGIASASLGVSPVSAIEHDGHAQAAGIEISASWARATPRAGANTAAYLSIANRGDTALVLTGVSSDATPKAALHETVVEDSGVARMIHRDEITIPAGETLTMQPGGTHVMLLGVPEALKDGSVITITLETKDGKTIPVPVEVRGRNAAKTKAE